MNIRLNHPSTSNLDRPPGLLSNYKEWLKEQGFSKHTKRNYFSKIERFLTFTGFLFSADEPLLAALRRQPPLADTYVSYLRDSVKSCPSSINANLTAIASFYRFLGLSFSTDRRKKLLSPGSKALSPEEKTRLLSTIDTWCSLKERAILLLFLSTGIRLGECAALNVGDVITAGQAQLVVGNKRTNMWRSIPLDESVNEALLARLITRQSEVRTNDETALFVNSRGERMSCQGMDLIIRKIGISSGLLVSAQVLRDTFLTDLAMKSKDAFRVAEISGCKRLDSTRKYFDFSCSIKNNEAANNDASFST